MRFLTRSRNLHEIVLRSHRYLSTSLSRFLRVEYLDFANLAWEFIRRPRRSDALPFAYLVGVSHQMHSLCPSSSRPSMMCPLFLNQPSRPVQPCLSLQFNRATPRATDCLANRNSSTSIDRKVNAYLHIGEPACSSNSAYTRD